MAEKSPWEDSWPEQISPKLVAGVIAALLVLLGVYTSFFTVEPEEVAVITRFGKFSRTQEPGLHFKFPYGIENVRKVPVERQLKEEFGFRTQEADVRTRYDKRAFQEEALMLTGDLNAAQVEWIVQYRIKDPYNYLFKVRDAQKTFRDINEAIMREVVGDRTVSEVLTIGRQEIADSVQQQIQQLCDEYETGLRVEQVVLQDVNPPDMVKPAFNEVNEAQQERERLINQAKAEYNKVIPKAKGDALRTIEEAKGYASERVNRAKGDVAQFTAVYEQYRLAKDVTKKRLYLETMMEIMKTVDRKIITSEKIEGMLPLLQMNGQRSK